jgi:hypothetical protein
MMPNMAVGRVREGGIGGGGRVAYFRKGLHFNCVVNVVHVDVSRIRKITKRGGGKGGKIF